MTQQSRRNRWTGWLTRKPSLLRPFPSLRCEELETRVNPTTFTWTGGIDSVWSTPGNWKDGAAPTGNPALVEDLVFGVEGAARLTADNDLPGGATFNSITISLSDYQLVGSPIRLGRPGISGSGTLVVGTGVLGAVIDLDTTLSAGTTFGSLDQNFTIQSGGKLTYTGEISGPVGSTLTKDGPGELVLSADNSGFTGPMKLNNNSGILTITHPLALGDLTNGTTVGSGSSLKVEGVVGTINEAVIINGFGVANDGALQSTLGTANTWAGQVILDSDAAVGAANGTTLNITGVVSDLGAGHNIVKEGQGEVQFNSSTGNTYRGLTTINDGILTIGTSTALGASGAPGNGTIVNETVTKAGQLRLRSLTGANFSVVNEFLTLNGDGVSPTPDARSGANPGALTNTLADNTWAGEVVLGSPLPTTNFSVWIGAAANTNLTISGVISSPNFADNLIKVDGGRLIFNNANTYTGTTTVSQGILNIRDSQGLGSTAAGTTVNTNAALELEVEAANPNTVPRFDDRGRDLWNDSITGNAHLLDISEPLTLNGRGVGNTGALRSVSGINRYLVPITLFGTAAIGVDLDQRPGHPSPDSTYFTVDYSLTTQGSIREPSPVVGTLAKRGLGHLILPVNNTYNGQTFIEQGWVTVQSNIPFGPYISTLGPTVQRDTIVSSGAAVHIKKLTPASPNLTINENITIAGNGPDYLTYSFINGKGALMNLDGDNTWTAEIRLSGVAGIGVEQIPPATSSTLTHAATIRDSAIGALGGINKFGSQQLILEGDGTYTGNNDIIEGSLRLRHGMGLGLFTSGTATTQDTYFTTNTTVQSGAVLLIDKSIDFLNGGLASGIQVTNERLILNSPGQQIAVAGPLAPAIATYTLTFGGQTTAALAITATAAEVEAALNGLTNLVAATGPVTVTQSGNVYTVLFGGHVADVPLIVATPTPIPNQPPAEIRISGVTQVDGNPSEASVVTISEDNAWRGPVTLNGSTRIATSANTRLNILGNVDDTGSPAPADIVKRGNGELLLGGQNSYRGTTWIDNGVITVANSLALGSTANGTVVAQGAQMQLQGSLTVAGEPLTVQGSGITTASALVDQWFNVGPAPANNGQSPQSMPTSGRITSVVADPTDSRVIYVATAGGGVWKTIDSGVTWRQLFDATIDPLAVLYGGSVVVSPTDPRVVYFATGEMNGINNGSPQTGQQDNYAGTGVYRSADAGLTWSLLTGPAGENPLFGQGITKILIDPLDARRIYVSSGNRNVINADPLAVPGVYRYDLGVANPNWVNLTATASPNRAAVAGVIAAPITAGPDDDYRIAFPQTNATWSDIFLVASGVNSPGSNPGNRITAPTGQVVTWVLYAALGESTQSYYTGAANPAILNAVYRTEDPANHDNPTWWLGTGTVYPVAQTLQTPSPPPIPAPTLPDLRGAGYPTGPVEPPNPFHQPGRNEWIKLAGVVTNYYNTNMPAPYAQRSVNASITVYATNLHNSVDFWTSGGTNRTGQMQDIQKSGWDGGIATAWTNNLGAIPTPEAFGTTNVTANPPQFATGKYDSVLLSQDLTPGLLGNNSNQIVYLGGKDFLFQTTNGGASWQQVAAGANGIYPAARFHALSFNRLNGELMTGTDGGLWSWDGATFEDLNGNLTATLVNSVDAHPTSFNQALAGAYNTGLQRFSTDLAWTAIGANTGRNAGDVRYNTGNPLFGYAAVNGQLWNTTDGGNNWNLLRTVSTAANLFPIQLDTQNPNRILVGGAGVFQSQNSGVPGSFVNLNSGLNPVTLIGTATFQGTFVQDPGFTQVIDRLSNTYDPNTIYVSNGSTIRVTKDGGVSWQSRPPYVNTVFAVTFGGTAAGQNVQQLGTPFGTTGVTISTQTQGGGGTNEVQLVQVVGAAGGFFRLRVGGGFGGENTGLIPFTATPQDVADALNNLTTFINNGTIVTVATVPGASANTITDIAVDPSNRDTVYVTVRGTRSNTSATVFRSTDAGQTWVDLTGNLPQVQTWTVVVDPRTDTLYIGNDQGVFKLPDASTNTTLVWTEFGAGLANVQVQDLVLNQTVNTLTAGTYGRGVYQVFLTDSQADAGAVRAISGASVWTGPVTLTGDTVLGTTGSQNLQNGVAAASLNIIGAIQDDVAGANHTITKIGGGTVTLSGDNTSGNSLGGNIIVAEGVLQVNNPHALGSPTTGNTLVVDGAALELRSNLELEPITIFGDGIKFPLPGGGFSGFNGHFTGALRNVANSNTYTGVLTFGDPLTTRGTATIGVDTGTSLTIGSLPGVLLGNGSITDGGLGHVFEKELQGTLVLANANNYLGETRVIQGALQVQHPNALGSTTNGTVVLDGAQLQLARNRTTLIETVVSGEAVSLSGTGINTTGAMQNVRGDGIPTGTNNNTWNGPITITMANPNFAPATNPGSQVALGSSDVRDSLIIDEVIAQAAGQGSLGLIKVGPGKVILNRANTYQGVTNVNAGTLQVRNNDALGPVVSSEVQTVSLVGVLNLGTGLPFTFQLRFNGANTVTLNSTITAATLQGILNGLATIGGVGGNVTVFETTSVNGKVFTITFGGSLANLDQPLFTAINVSAGFAVNIAEVQKGGLGTVVAAGAGLELAGVPTALNVFERLMLNGDGAGATRPGALDNVINNNIYSGPITLATDASIGAAPGTMLTVVGALQDPTPSPVPAARFRKAGTGTVILPDAKNYGGTTIVDEGVLRIQNPLSLGQIRSEVQNVQVLSSNGTFNLTFAGQTTGAIPWDATAAQVQTALNALSTIGAEIQTLKITGTTGAFTVTFNGATTAALPVTIPASGGAGPTGSLQNALNALSTIGGVGGNVVVTSVAAAGGGTLYTITFGGTLVATDLTQIIPMAVGGDAATFPETVRNGGVYATVVRNGVAGNANYVVSFTGALGNRNLPLMSAVGIGGTLALTTTVQDGQEGTVVTAGATLQVDAGVVNMTSEALTINGLGFDEQGALNNFAGNNVWAAPITLGSDASIGVTSAANTLSITRPISDNGLTRNLEIIGPGTVSYNGVSDNQYTGITTVRSGNLLLNQATGLAILGPLVVGDTLPGAGLVRALTDNQIADGVPLTVKSDGTFDLNGRTDVIGTTTIIDGTATTGANGHLSTSGLFMTGGSLTMGVGGETILRGNITAASSPTGPALILGPGNLNLNSIVRTITVIDGPNNEDVRISAGLTAVLTEHLIKNGTGRLTAFPAAPSTVAIEVQLGDLQVDTTIGPVQLNGGSLSGNGTVGNLTGSISPSAVGFITPGVTYAANTVGILTTGNATWGGSTTYFVNLSNDVPLSPIVPGVDHDQLIVRGNITLGGAKLQGTFGAGIRDLDSFTIIQTTGGGVVSGTFQSGGSVFIGQQKFTINYFSDRVVLTKVKANAALSLTSSINPSTFQQPVLFTATLVPETGAGAIPPGSTVTFTLDGVTYPAVPVVGNVATFNPQTALGGPLSGGTHTLSAVFSGDALSFASTSATLAGGQVVEVPTIDPLTTTFQYISPTNASSIGVQDSTTLATAGQNERVSSPTTPAWTITISDLGNTPVRTFTGVGVIPPGGSSFPISALWNGTDDFGLPLPDGTYIVNASYVDLFGNIASTPGLFDPVFTVVIDNTSPTASPLTNPNPVIAPGTSSTVANGTTLTSTISDVNLNNWTVEIRNNSNVVVRTFNGTGSTVNVTWDGRDGGGGIVPNGTYNATLTARDLAGNRFTTANTQIVVLTTAPTISLSTNSPTRYGQDITFTATLTLPTFVPGSVSSTLTSGIVEFFNGADSLGTAPIIQSGGQFLAIFTTPTFNAGTYTSLHANFLGSSNFLPANSANATHSVQQAVLSVIADSKFKVTGAPLPPLTYQVAGLTNGDTIASTLSGALATTATASSPVGSYPITQGSLAVIPQPDMDGNGFPDVNYIISFTSGILSVVSSPFILTVTADAISKPYGAAVPTLTYQVSGLQPGDTVATVLAGSLATTANASTPAGAVVPITQGTLTSINPNYTISYVSNNLTVTQAPLTITADDLSRIFGVANPPLTATFNGLVNGDTSAVVNGLNLTTPATTSSPIGTYPITDTGAPPTAANYAITFVPGTLTVTRPNGGSAVPNDIAAGSGAGLANQVKVYSPNGVFKYSLFPFAPDFAGGIRTAAADFNGDGITDIVAGTGPGVPTQVIVFSGADQSVLFSVNPFESSFTGGVYVAAGDITGDGEPELIITPDEGGGPRVQVYNGNGFVKTHDFLGIDDANFRGGARAATGDITGDGVGDLIIAAGFGGGPRVSIYDGAALNLGQLVHPVNDFFVFEQSLRNGAFIASGDLDGDGFADLITAGGPGGAPRVQILNGADLLQGAFTPMANFFAADVESRGGARVSTTDINGDGLADVVTGDGSTLGSRLSGYASTTLLIGGTSWDFSFDTFPGFTGGIYVG